MAARMSARKIQGVLYRAGVPVRLLRQNQATKRRSNVRADTMDRAVTVEYVLRDGSCMLVDCSYLTYLEPKGLIDGQQTLRDQAMTALVMAGYCVDVDLGFFAWPRPYSFVVRSLDAQELLYLDS